MVDYLSAVDSLAGIAILALVAFLDSLIGASFFVFGEIAFLAAGASFASDGAITPALTVLIFAYAGDMVSFALGRRYGKRLVVRFLQPCKRRRAWRKAQTALKKRGAVFVVLSRFMGPLAWVTPFMAGVVGMQYRVFAWAAAIGVVLAVGQFLLLGALGLMLIGPLISFVVTHAVVIVLCSTIVFVSIYLWCQCKQSILRRLCHIAGVSVLVFLTANFAYFFVFNFHPVSNAPWQKLNYACDLND